MSIILQFQNNEHMAIIQMKQQMSFIYVEKNTTNSLKAILLYHKRYNMQTDYDELNSVMQSEKYIEFGTSWYNRIPCELYLQP